MLLLVLFALLSIMSTSCFFFSFFLLHSRCIYLRICLNGISEIFTGLKLFTNEHFWAASWKTRSMRQRVITRLQQWLNSLCSGTKARGPVQSHSLKKVHDLTTPVLNPVDFAVVKRKFRYGKVPASKRTSTKVVGTGSFQYQHTRALLQTSLCSSHRDAYASLNSFKRYKQLVLLVRSCLTKDDSYKCSTIQP